MGIVYIGDCSVGKTHLAMELANPKNEHVKVLSPDYEALKGMLFDDTTASVKPTDAAREVDLRPLEIQAKLASGLKSIEVKWVDTPGEVWREHWQKDNPDKWHKFADTVRKSEGILLVLNPHRSLLPTSIASEYPTQEQWCKRFQRWIDFFRYDCPKAKHIVLCLNKADLFCKVEQEAAKLAFHPNGSEMTWWNRHIYVLQKYFHPIQQPIEQIGQSTTGLSVQCFITSIHSRSLLELPWIYLANYLAR